MIKKREKTIPTAIWKKESIIAEYLLGEISYRQLGFTHNIDFRLIHSWVKKFQGRQVQKSKQKLVVKHAPIEQLPTDVKELQEQLRKSKLHVELLNTMIDIAEDQLKISIRKKSGTKR
jgi:transposase-like protein